MYYTQGAAEAALAALEDGESNVICEQRRLIKMSRDKGGVLSREVLTRHWTDWVDYWAVDFDYQSRREIIKVPKDFPSPSGRGWRAAPGEGSGSPDDSREAEPSPPTPLPEGEGSEAQFEERWTGGYIFENEWQSFRTRKQRELELTTTEHTYDQPGRYTVAVKVIDFFGNDTMTLAPVTWADARVKAARRSGPNQPLKNRRERRQIARRRSAASGAYTPVREHGEHRRRAAGERSRLFSGCAPA